MIEEIQGRALQLGDNMDTDQIFPSRYIEITDEREMAKHALEGIDPDLSEGLSEYNILVAGRNLGCGSSRENAPRSLHAAGIQILVAESFARIFFRNAINIGLPAISLPSTREIETGDRLKISLREGILINTTRGLRFVFRGFSGLVGDILNAGGLVEYYKQGKGVHRS